LFIISAFTCARTTVSGRLKSENIFFYVSSTAHFYLWTQLNVFVCFSPSQQQSDSICKMKTK